MANDFSGMRGRRIAGCGPIPKFVPAKDQENWRALTFRRVGASEHLKASFHFLNVLYNSSSAVLWANSEAANLSKSAFASVLEVPAAALL
jgi:hypothetical protein